jgi:hypothetical protein
VPNLGRGYSIRNNKLQAMCFEKVAESRPTFDFSYEIKEVSTADLNKITSNPLQRILGTRVASFLREHLEDAAKIDQADGGRTRTILAQILVNTYHRSLDEPSSIINKSSRQLLEDHRYETFFTSCGFFYVRSVKTFATYTALLQYRSSGNAADDDKFQDRLEQGLLSFGGQPALEKKRDDSLSQEASRRGLRVFITALGLAKGKSMNLVPTSIDQFRETIQSAGSLMEVADTGSVSQLEIAPWIDHPDVALIMHQNLAKNDDQTRTAFQRMHNLEINTQVVTAIQEYRDFLMSRFHLASLCEEILTQQFPFDRAIAEKEQGRYYDADKTYFYNQSRENDDTLWVSLKQFTEHFKNSPPGAVLDRIRNFMYGDGKNPGADDCLNQLFTKGVDTIDFASIPSCVYALRVEKVNFVFLQEYCLPKPARSSFLTPSSLKR